MRYLSLCPRTYFKKENFYLKSLSKPAPIQWYGREVVGTNTLSKVVKKMMGKAEIEGFFTNHSARRTGGTGLFQAGVNRKLIKEATGHTSDAVDKYHVTSHEQHRCMSNILQNGPKSDIEPERENIGEDKSDKSSSVNVKSDEGFDVRQEVTTENVGLMINRIIASNTDKGKTTIKIQIEISHE